MTNRADEYFTIFDVQGNTITLYNDNGKMLICQCYEINEIELITQADKCYKDIPIYYSGIVQNSIHYK